MKAIVLVAGYAVRLYPLTENKPKGLLKLGDKTLLDYLFEKLERVEAVDEAILISNNKFYNQFCEWSQNYNGRIKTKVLNDYTNSNEDRLGAIGDMQYVIDKCKIDDEIMVLVSDNYFDFELSDFYDFYKEKNTDCILGTEFKDKEKIRNRFGVAVLDENDKVVNMVEKPSNPPSNFVVFASYIYTKDTVRMIKQYLQEGNNKDAPGNFPSWLYSKKPVHAFRFEGECYDIGTIESYNELNERFKERSINGLSSTL